MAAILVPENELNTTNGCLNEYLDNDRQKTKTILPGELAVQDSKIFEQNIYNITNQLNKFLTGPQREIAFLVLGKIQSGKTANLLGTIAWAADSRVSLCVLLTGVTEALNDQTAKRINKDLITKLAGQYIKVYQVPTSATGQPFEELYRNVAKWIERRGGNGNNDFNKPLPVLVTLKNPSRVKTLKTLIEKLEVQFSTDLVTLLIDDEADQASQNAGARKKSVTATYKAIKELRDLDSRNIMLSYTATPQAVMLAERTGRLRPNYCVTVEPRAGYFGLENAVSSEFSRNITEVDDWIKKPSKMKSAPLSLRKALIRFTWTAWIRFYNQDLFYSEIGISADLLPPQLKSVQMLVHESSSQREHGSVYELVTDEIESLTEAVTNAVEEKSTKSQVAEVIELWEQDLIVIKDSLPEKLKAKLNVEIDVNFLRQILGLIDDLKVLVINSDPNRPGPDENIPIEDEIWEQSKLWILIGGDILGRGLTIPQLTTTYFLRHPKKPNYDTVFQQMRFCGYRNNYKLFTYLFAQGQTIGIFKVMNQINNVVWRMAKKWDREKLNILDNMPPIMYASKPDVILDPCRKAVQDPNLIDKKIRGDIIFSSKDIFSPQLFKANLKTLNAFINESKLIKRSYKEWSIFQDPSDSQMQRILATWSTSPKEQTYMIGAAELFEPELGELGISDIPRNILVHNSLLNGSHENILSFISDIKVTRQVSSLPNSSLAKWIKIFKAPFGGGQSNILWPVLTVQHIGDGQRSTRKAAGVLQTTIMIEPVTGHIGKAGVSKPVAVGIAITIMNPPEFEIRMIGLEIRLDSSGVF